MRYGVTLAALATLLASGAAHAGALVTNGSFEQTSGTSAGGLCSTGNTFFNDGCVQNITGWTNTSTYSFVASSANLGIGYDNGNGNANVVLAGMVTASPDGGNFLAVDGDSNINANNSFGQMLTGLHIGDNYAVTFYQAGGEQNKVSLPTTEQWQVSLGGTTKLGTLMQDAAGSFTGWSLQTLIFNATSTTEFLSFDALGTPNGAPPFVLLDGVTVADVPEPATLVMLAAGSLALIAARRRRQTR